MFIRRGAAVKHGFVGAEDAALKSVSVGIRPVPHDGLPIIGYDAQVARLYLTVIHAGVTLAPLVGRLAATEILDESELGILDHCRPGWFSSG